MVLGMARLRTGRCVAVRGRRMHLLEIREYDHGSEVEMGMGESMHL